MPCSFGTDLAMKIFQNQWGIAAIARSLKISAETHELSLGKPCYSCQYVAEIHYADPSQLLTQLRHGFSVLTASVEPCY